MLQRCFQLQPPQTSLVRHTRRCAGILVSLHGRLFVHIRDPSQPQCREEKEREL